MTGRIAKGTAPRRAPAGRGQGRPAVRRRAKRPGPLERLGFSAEGARRVWRWTISGMVAAVVVTAILAFRLPQLAGQALAQGVGQAGFEMSRVEIKGAQRVSRLEVYNIAFDQPSMAMPSIDLDATRARLLRYGWIKEARVHRRLPDTLVIDIVERQPAAIWQHEGRFTLIDDEGVVLEPVRVEAKPDLPLLVGPAANVQVAALGRLLDAAPHLRPQVEAATWIGGRRWDVHFQTGEVLTLPEGEDAARDAIARFARMDRQTQMLGRGLVRFDMRMPGRIVVRVSREPGSTVPAEAPDPGPRPADLSRTI